MFVCLFAWLFFGVGGGRGGWGGGGRRREARWGLVFRTFHLMHSFEPKVRDGLGLYKQFTVNPCFKKKKKFL